MRWFWDREEDEPKGLTRRSFLFLGAAAGASIAAAPLLDLIPNPPDWPYADVIGPLEPVIANDVLAVFLEKYRDVIPRLFEAENNICKQIEMRTNDFAYWNGTIWVPTRRV